MTSRERERILARYRLRAKVFETIAAERTRLAGPAAPENTTSVRALRDGRILELKGSEGDGVSLISQRLAGRDPGASAAVSNGRSEVPMRPRPVSRSPDGLLRDSPLRVLVADDHPAIVEAVAGYLAEEEDIELVGCASNGTQALRLIAERTPDIVLLDLRMPELGGLETLKRLDAQPSPPAVIVFTGYPDHSLLLEALDAGARGFLPKETPIPVVVDAVREVAAGATYVDPVLAGTLATDRNTADQPGLTKREREILRLLADGMRNERVAQVLSISPLTVRMHVRHAMEKLGATTRTQAVATALRHSLIT